MIALYPFLRIISLPEIEAINSSSSLTMLMTSHIPLSSLLFLWRNKRDAKFVYNDVHVRYVNFLPAFYEHLLPLSTFTTKLSDCCPPVENANFKRTNRHHVLRPILYSWFYQFPPYGYHLLTL